MAAKDIIKIYGRNFTYTKITFLSIENKVYDGLVSAERYGIGDLDLK